jgi:hypothetical protein
MESESTPTLYSHAPLTDYFVDSPPPGLFAQWTRYLEERPNLAITELINMLVFIAGSSVTVLPPQIQSSSTEEIQISVSKDLILRSPDSPISRYINGVDRRAESFWIDLSRALILPRLWTASFFLKTFDVFKAWLFSFCEAAVLPLRQAAIVVVLAFHSTVAESISDAVEELARLETAQKGGDWPCLVMRCRSRLEASRVHSLQFITPILRHRNRDADPAICALCLAAANTTNSLTPDEVGNPDLLNSLARAVGDPCPAIHQEALNQARALLPEIEFDSVCAQFLGDLRDRLVSDPLKITQHPEGIRNEGIALASLRLMTEFVARAAMPCPSLKVLSEMIVGSRSLRAAAATLVELALNEAPKVAPGHTIEAHFPAVSKISFCAQSREIITTGVDDTVGRRFRFPDLSPAPVSVISGMEAHRPTCFTFLAPNLILFGTKTSKILSMDWPACHSAELVQSSDVAVDFLCSHPNATGIAFAGQGQVFVRPADRNAKAELIFRTDHQILFLEFGPKCGTLVIVSGDCTVRTFDSESGELCELSAPVPADPGCCLCCFYADSDLFLSDEETL